jgi:hypothetical protein
MAKVESDTFPGRCGRFPPGNDYVLGVYVPK